MDAVGTRGVPTVVRVGDAGLEAIDHTKFYGAPGRIAELVISERAPGEASQRNPSANPIAV